MERTRRHVSYANVAATLALVFAMSGGAIAATGGFTAASNGIKACAASNGVLKLQTGKKCAKGQKAVSWSQAGPEGAAGAKGVSGAAGAAGANGANGAKGDPGASGQPTNVLWARIDSDGVIETEGHGVIDVDDEGESPYIVTFDRDVSQCAVVASQDSAIRNLVVSDVRHLTSLGHPDQVRLHVMNFSSDEDSAGFSIVATC